MRQLLVEINITLLRAVAVAVLCSGIWTALPARVAMANDDEPSLRHADRTAFGNSSVNLTDKFLDPNFTWTDSHGNTQNKSEILEAVRQRSGMARSAVASTAIEARTYGRVAVVQENAQGVYVLRIWVKRGADWTLLVYQEVSTGAAPLAGPATEECDNPCKTVPFEPQNENQKQVIHAYQAVERAVTAHDSAAWGAHIADEFFAITSNSDRPLDKATRMAGLDHQKEGGIAPFPLVSARMFEFGDAMVMISRQQPKHGLPLHVTRVWFQRNGAWLEAYSYQTTIREGGPAR